MIEPSPISRIRSGENTCATRPIARCTRTLVPSDTAIPADSWPRCCSEKRPKYVRFATSIPLAQIPKTPHIDLVFETSFPGLAHVHHRGLNLAFELEHVAAGHPEQRDLDVVAPGQRLQLGHRARRRADDEAAWGLAEERGGQAERRLKRQRRAAHAHAAEQAALGERDQQAAVRAVV